MSGELQRLSVGPEPEEVPGGGMLIEVWAASSSVNASFLLKRIKGVLAPTIVAADGEWPALTEWRKLLPIWFVEACAKEETAEESEKWLEWWRGLDDLARNDAAQARPWSLADWLHWLHPKERQWFWWDASVIGDSLRVVVSVNGWPSPLGALEWLLKAAGAERIDVHV